MGEIIKMLRIQSGLTQEELGQKVGVQKSAVRKWEKGEVENIKRSVIQEMAKIFNVNPCYLMGWEDNFNPNGKLAKEVSLIEEIQMQFENDAVQLLQLYTELNETGKQKALESISDLSEIDRYTIKFSEGCSKE